MNVTHSLFPSRKTQVQQIPSYPLSKDSLFIIRKEIRRSSLHGSINLSPSPRKGYSSIEKQEKRCASPDGSGKIRKFHIKKTGTKIQFCATQNIFVFKNKKSQKIAVGEYGSLSPRKAESPTLSRRPKYLPRQKQKEINNCQKIDWQFHGQKIEGWQMTNQPEEDEFNIMNV